MENNVHDYTKNALKNIFLGVQRRRRQQSFCRQHITCGQRSFGDDERQQILAGQKIGAALGGGQETLPTGKGAEQCHGAVPLVLRGAGFLTGFGSAQYGAFQRENLDTDFYLKGLRRAVADYGRPEIVNTDQGCQFTSELWRQYLMENEILQSMDGRGRWVDNVVIERF